MLYNITTKIQSEYDLCIIPVFKDQKKLDQIQRLDKKTQELFEFTNMILQEHSSSLKFLQHRLLYNPNDLNQKVLLLGVGEKEKINCYNFNKIAKTAVSIIISNEYLEDNSRILSFLSLLDINSLQHNTFQYKIRQIILASNDANYDIKVCKEYNDIYNSKIHKLKYNLDIFIPEQNYSQESSKELELYNTINESVDITKNLANLPANICTPEFIANEALKLSDKHEKMSINILDEDELEKLGFGSFLSVSKSSHNSGKLIILNYNYNADNSSTNPYVLIGKGITFDTGGYSLKPRTAMVGMKYDMCGAASVLGTLSGIAELGLDIPVVGILACAENMVSKSATRPDDVVTSLSGQTIEITNTDAEGRLVLCDAITYACKMKPKVIIDIATLTGAALIAVGTNYTAYVSNNNELISKIDKAADMVYEPIWRLPLAEEYFVDLESKFADMKNASSSGFAGTIIGGLFLSKFIENNTWAHLDIAGSSTRFEKHEEATGRPVPLLMQYLFDEASS